MDKIEKIRNPYLTEDEKMDIIADAIEEGGGGGGDSSFVPIDVTINDIQSGIGIDVTADKTPAEVYALAKDGKNLAVRLSIEEAFGDFAAGVYIIPLLFSGPMNLIAATVIGIDMESYYTYGQGIYSGGEYHGKIYVTPISQQEEK